MWVDTSKPDTCRLLLELRAVLMAGAHDAASVSCCQVAIRGPHPVITSMVLKGQSAARWRVWAPRLKKRKPPPKAGSLSWVFIHLNWRNVF